MRRIAVINQKGGVGKTTTTANLAAAISRLGKKTLVIDLDPQGHLSLHLGCEVTPGHSSVYDVLVDSVPVKDVAVSVGERTTLIPSDIDLAAAEPELMGIVGREVILREAINAYDVAHDYLFIDCPPSLGVLTINALATADEVLIPLQAHFFALQGLGKLLNTVTLVRQRINPKLRVSGVVLCMYDAGTKLASEIVDDLSSFLANAKGTGVAWADARLFQTRIRRNIKLAESASFGKSVFEYDAKSNGALDYESLAKEILAQEVVVERTLPKPKVVKPARPRKKTEAVAERNNEPSPATREVSAIPMTSTEAPVVPVTATISA